jgi:hypothetical protein
VEVIVIAATSLVGILAVVFAIAIAVVAGLVAEMVAVSVVISIGSGCSYCGCDWYSGSQ